MRGAKAKRVRRQARAAGASRADYRRAKRRANGRPVAKGTPRPGAPSLVAPRGARRRVRRITDKGRAVSLGRPFQGIRTGREAALLHAIGGRDLARRQAAEKAGTAPKRHGGLRARGRNRSTMLNPRGARLPK